MLFGVLTVVVAANDSMNQPVPNDGDCWIFKGTTRDSISSSSDRFDGTYEVCYRGGELQMGNAVGGNTARELKRMIIPDEREYLKFPLTVGSKWTGKYFLDVRSGWPSMTYIVAGIEEVAVGGGSFRAYKIEGDGTVSVLSGTYRQKRLIWYSPDAKSVVKFFYDSAIGSVGAKVEIELQGFIPAAK